MTAAALDPRTPVLAGWAAVSQRVDDPHRACEPLALMIAATQRAGKPELLASAERIYVPKGRWRYRNPGAAIAAAIGARSAATVLAHVGVLQQSLIGDACRSIRDREIEIALVVGGDAGYRLQRAKSAGIRPEDQQQTSEPDHILTAKEELLHPAELRVGLQMPVGSYALLHSACAAAGGADIGGERCRIAERLSDLSRIAVDNPDAWRREFLTVEQIRDASPRNPMQAFPYTRRHCTNWSVDQAACLVLCSVAKARQLGLDLDACIFPIASTEANHMLQVSTRPQLHRCRGARLAGDAAMAAADCRVADVDLIELYSCFPAAIEIFAAELGLPADRPLSVTGGMAMAGGPFNNYVLQATCRMADLLARRGRGQPPANRGATGLVSSVSGLLTKQGFGLWSSRPIAYFSHVDVTADLARQERPVAVAMDFAGPAAVAAATVLYEKGVAAKSVVIADTSDGRRVVAESSDPAVVRRVEEVGLCGATIDVSDGYRFAVAS